MKKQNLLFLILCALLTLAGMAGGWFAAHQKLEGSAALHEGQDSEMESNDHNQCVGGISLPPQTLENMGVFVAEAKLTTFQRYREIPAQVTETPATYQPVFAPIGGRIQEIQAEFGSMVKGGEVIITLIRDALPRPQLTLTEEVLKPATEEFHQNIGRLRTTLRGLKILEIELKRLEKFSNNDSEDDLPILPMKDLIELRYDVSRAEQELENIRQELRLHGLGDEEIDKIEKGGEARISLRFWYDALNRNGLWPADAEEIYQKLPEAIRDAPWTVATISELVAADLADGLAAWLDKNREAGRCFPEIGGLLQGGASLADVKSLCGLGVFEPVVAIRAPADAEDWDVNGLFIKPGEQVEKGSRLLILANPRTMFLRVESVGGETAALLTALRENVELEARPLVPDTGPLLKGLKILNLVNEDLSEGTVAYIPVANEPFQIVEHEGGKRFRSWNLRDGLRYMLRIPVENEGWTDVFVVPVDAVTEDGPNKIVFIQDGDRYKPVKVVLLYMDQEAAVLGKDSEIFPGDRVVQQGAFGLGLAMKAGRDEIVDEHGHVH